MKLTVPGNILLSGEYAVLEEGGLGLACAVEPRVVVTTRAAATLRIVGVFGRSTVTWPTDSTGSDLFGVAVRHLMGTRAGFLPEKIPVEVTVDSSEFYTADGRKRGLGSSAAVVVALLAALDSLSHFRRGESDPAGTLPGNPGGDSRSADRFLFEGVALHRQLQGGRGSGYDVAASLFGGCGIFSGGIRPSWRPAQVAWLQIPGAASTGATSRFGLRVVEGRRPVRSASAVASYEAWRRRQPEGSAAFLRRSNRLVAALDSAKSQEEAIAALRDLARTGIELGEKIGVSAKPDFPTIPGWFCKAAGAGNETVICLSDPRDPPADSRSGAPGEALPVAREGLVIVEDTGTEE